MAQHDFVIDNQGFPAFRSDLNNVLSAIASNSSGATEPTTTYAYQWWYDSTTDTLKMRNADDDAWISIGTFNQTTDAFTPSGLTTDKIEEGNSSVEVVDSGTGYITFVVDGVEASRIDSSGNLLVGKTSSSLSTAGVEAKADGALFATRTGDSVAWLNKLTADGDIVRFQKDGTSVGSIGTKAGKINIGYDDTGVTFQGFAADAITPWNTSTNSNRDAAVNLGYSTSRFKDLYLSGGVYLGGTGAANYLDDYEEGTFTPTFTGEATAGTYTVSSSKDYYIKIGSMVHIYIDVNFSAASGGSGLMKIGGLPFNYKANPSIAGSVVAQSLNTTATSSNGIGVKHRYASSDNTVYLALTKDNASWEEIQAGAFSTSTRVMINFSYQAA